MTIEERLTDALHRADQFEPSPDLYARVERSISEDIAHRRRLVLLSLSLFGAIALVASYIRLGVVTGAEGLTIGVGRLLLADLGVLVAFTVVLAPNIRRFARSYVAELFHLSPATGDRFLRVLDLAYYILFAGVILINTDNYGAWGDIILLREGLQTLASRIAVLLLVMGVLHAINVATMPVLGLVFNSLTRLAIRAEAGSNAPPETLRAARADRNARAFVIALMVVLGALVLVQLAGLLVGSFS